jgi:hypothetical protein
MIAKMRTVKAQEIYKLRQQTVEPVFGDKGNNRISDTRNTIGADRVQLGVHIKEYKTDMGCSNGKNKCPYSATEGEKSTREKIDIGRIIFFTIFSHRLK